MKIPRRLKPLVPYLKNKYLLAFTAFLVWITFFDQNNLITQHHYRKQLRELENKKAYYLSEIEKNKQDLEALLGNKQKLERFAREKYLMKKDAEEIFIVVENLPEEP